MISENYPRILIVGAGPVGQMAALLLAQHGLPSLLIDRRETTLSAPKAHAVNARTLEICDQVGVSAARLRKLGATANDGGDVRFVSTLTGTEFGSLPYERQDDGAFEATPFPLTNIPQPLFEQELTAKIDLEPLIDFRRGIECQSLTTLESSVEATLSDRKESSSEQMIFDYVIAADGAGSRIRESLSIEMEGPEALARYLMIHFTADLRHLTQGRRGVLYFLFEPGVDGALIAYDHAKTWVLMHPYNPELEKLESYDDETCLRLIQNAVGQTLPTTTVENVSPWMMSAQVAKAYRKGRIFLAGDAAHRIPPAGGLGLNTGIGDVQNLIWKLAVVLNEEAGKALLDTYETERQPIARVNNEQSMNNAAKIFDLIIALHGLEPEKASERFAAVKADPQAYTEIAAAVEAQRPHFDSFDLQMGYRYASSAIFEASVVPDSTDVSNYQPSWDVGVHFPHQWIKVNGQTEPFQRIISPTSFTLLLGPNAETFEGSNTITPIVYGKYFSAKPWPETTHLPDEGALLIRPDGHIAARFNAVDANQVASVLNKILAIGE